jgi:hypothetical protein
MAPRTVPPIVHTGNEGVRSVVWARLFDLIGLLGHPTLAWVDLPSHVTHLSEKSIVHV